MLNDLLAGLAFGGSIGAFWVCWILHEWGYDYKPVMLALGWGAPIVCWICGWEILALVSILPYMYVMVWQYKESQEIESED